MTFEQAISGLDTDFDNHGYSRKMAKSSSRNLHLINSKYGLCKCGNDWPSLYNPTKEDVAATDWKIYEPNTLTS